jgi:hypothetical protein
VTSQTIGLCFAYFTVGDVSFRHKDLLILALFRQLCQDQDDIPGWLWQAKSDGRDPLETASVSNLVALASRYRQTYIVLDGLDECPERERQSVLELIVAIRQANATFKIFLTSRRENDIARCFSRKGVIQLQTSSDGNSADIESFIYQETLRLRHSSGVKRLKVKSDTLFNNIVSTLTEKADGM